jgi:hypothetical protein
MAAPTRFPGGLNNATRNTTLKDFLGPDPTKYFMQFVDFTGLDYATGAWTVTETQAGATQSLVAADAAGEYGLLALVNTAGATDVNSIQLTTAQTFMASGKKWWLKGRISRSNADQAMGFGVQAANATPFTLADGAFISVAGASTDATFAIGVGSATTTATGTAAYGTSALNTFVTLGMAYNGKNAIDCFVNDVLVTQITTLTNLPTAALLLTVSGQATTANARTVHADYVMWAVER